MDTEILDVRNAARCDSGAIDCEVLFSGVKDAQGNPGYLPFTATQTDMTAHGRALYAGLVAGKYGAVTPCVITPEILAAARAVKYGAIDSWRIRQENGRYVFTFNGRNWDYGKETQDRLGPSVAVARQGGLPAGFAWTDADNNDVPMNAGDLLALNDAVGQAMFSRGLAIHLRQRAMKAEVDALTTLDAVRAYQPGWPEEA